MTPDAWELYDTTTQSLLAVGSIYDCALARLDVLAALPAQSSSPGELVVRPHVRPARVVPDHAFAQQLRSAINAMRG